MLHPSHKSLPNLKHSCIPPKYHPTISNLHNQQDLHGTPRSSCAPSKPEPPYPISGYGTKLNQYIRCLDKYLPMTPAKTATKPRESKPMESVLPIAPTRGLWSNTPPVQRATKGNIQRAANDNTVPSPVQRVYTVLSPVQTSERSFLSFLEYEFVPILPHENWGRTSRKI